LLSLTIAVMVQPSHDATKTPIGTVPTVLVVEDAHDSRELYASELSLAGFSVSQAEDGHKALDLALRLEPDVIVLDLMLPGINGYSVARLVRTLQRQRRSVIIAVSAITSEPLRLAALDAGCDSFLSKPVVASRVVTEALLLLQRTRNATDPGPLPDRRA
jgi:DNA-binding response OmpR family regulator